MENNIQKRVYNTPEIDCIALDNDISLQLASMPLGPNESALSTMEITEMSSFEIY